MEVQSHYGNESLGTRGDLVSGLLVACLKQGRRAPWGYPWEPQAQSCGRRALNVEDPMKNTEIWVPSSLLLIVM